MKAKLLIAVAILLSGALVFGQGGYKGSITAQITTEDGSPLPGAVAELTADTFNRSFVSDANGLVRFVGLVPGVYELKVTFTGFNTYVRPNIVLDTGQNIRLTVPMTPATQQEEIVVTAETPILDKTKVGTATVLTEDELNAVPQARDPWSVVMTVPGIQTDRINIGGSEAGQQSNFTSKGDDGSTVSWVMDGVEFVDPAAKGGSQSYLDFSSFSQIGVTTGGADVVQRSPGANLNFVTKQGSNQHQGTIRLVYADEEFQSSTTPVTGPSGATFQGNSIGETFEKAFEIGGPLIKDRLWYWGSFNQNTINNILITGQNDRTELRNVSFKIHGDITSTTRFNAFYTEGDKIKDGRGGGVSRPQNTTWDQSGPSPIYKAEISQLIGQNTELSVLFGRVDGGFALAPKGTSGQIGIDLNTGIWDNTTFIDYGTTRPVRQYEFKGDTYLSSGSLDHELKYGFQYKEATVNSKTTYGSNSLIAYHYGPDPNNPGGLVGAAALLYREGNPTTDVEYNSFYLSDTVTYKNWTFKAGLRWDKQEGQNTASAVTANPVNPTLLPAVNFPGQGAPFDWSDIAPRLGATYTWGDDNQYLARASIARFYETLGTPEITDINPTFARYSYHLWSDDNHNSLVDTDEIGPSLGTDVNPDNPASIVTPDQIDPDLEAPQTDEFLLGFEWALNPQFTVGVNYTWRELSETLWRPLIGITSADYELAASPLTGVNPQNGQNFSIPYYILSEAGGAKNPNRARILTNRPGYTENYSGFELTATKRLSNRWMMRANLTFQDWSRDVPASAIQDPSDFWDGRNEDGGDIGVQSAGSGNRSNVFYGSASYAGNINGLYQLPWDVTVSASVNFREGFAFPLGFQTSVVDADGGTRNVGNGTDPASTVFKNLPFDAVRGDDIFLVDFKVTKTFYMAGRTKVEIGAEIFNLFDDDTLLARNLKLNQSTAWDPREVLSPRIGRFSASVQF